ncbi:UNKNOWN [Stylonychia lemnae]|uniref:Uncharacterized protein n=1 Tax=Stylonychia lemnae TaxID=5949 RepID=A0A078AR49_STYLE|nr:UNKNOWN [Stylonychia lemnae]|eukprot:CDW83722.1 UNKNOWN [Stylonychia lemnae]
MGFDIHYQQSFQIKMEMQKLQQLQLLLYQQDAEVIREPTIGVGNVNSNSSAVANANQFGVTVNVIDPVAPTARGEKFRPKVIDQEFATGTINSQKQLERSIYLNSRTW